MGNKYLQWKRKGSTDPQSFSELRQILFQNRKFSEVEKLEYGDWGLSDVALKILSAIKGGKRIALYADYDVDGTMSCVSWIWFFQAIGFTNYTYYIPCRFKEGYGLNMEAVEHLVDQEGAELIITMDTGITANQEAAYCKGRGVDFICTDHHQVQMEKMPDCMILNPKMNPDPSYQELCGCGITYVLLRRLGRSFPVQQSLWSDLLALAGMATICDIVPLNPVNHKIARLGVAALMRSEKEVIVTMREASALMAGVDEKDIGFRIGPRINAVGRLKHARAVVDAFVGGDSGPLVEEMDRCNEERKAIQQKIVEEATKRAKKTPNAPILFLGGDWHSGVVGIAASKLVDQFWCPVWLYQKKEGVCKGSARSITGFNVTEAMGEVGELFNKFGGHAAAGGFSFDERNEEKIGKALKSYGEKVKRERPEIWVRKTEYDCHLHGGLIDLELVDSLEQLKPFGMGFEEPKFSIEAQILSAQYYYDKISRKPKHTAVSIKNDWGVWVKVMFFNSVEEPLLDASRARFLVSSTKNEFRGKTSLTLIAHDYEIEA